MASVTLSTGRRKEGEQVLAFIGCGKLKIPIYPSLFCYIMAPMTRCWIPNQGVETSIVGACLTRQMLTPIEVPLTLASSPE